jgi:hypothetical protein
VIWLPLTCQVNDLAVGPHALIHIQYPAQRWTAFQDIGPSPCGRYGHAMACDGTRVFVLGGALSPGTQVNEAKLIHVLDTSKHFLFVIPFGQSSSLKQSSSFTRNPTPILSGIVRRPPNLRRSYPRVTRPRVNHNTGYSLYQMLERRTLFLSMLPLKTWAAPPYRRLLVSEIPV